MKHQKHKNVLLRRPWVHEYGAVFHFYVDFGSTYLCRDFEFSRNFFKAQGCTENKY